MSIDLDIARAATPKPIVEIGAALGLPASALLPYGRDKAKIAPEALADLQSRPDGAMILVTAITPTPAGEGKTTTTVGLGDGLARVLQGTSKRAAICLREPSLGPCFGMKGGAAGGGYAQILPMEDINLHFTGDFHAITAAHNLLAAMIDNHIHWGGAPQIDPRRVVWRRVMDMNDRSLRRIVSALGGPANGHPRETGFDITVASEVMAILCLAEDAGDLRRRLGAIVIGYGPDKTPVTCRDIKADGAMAALLREAVLPNLVQSLEGSPAFVHGGPFANIAHGCNSVIATKTALKLADYVVTEAGFGADLGAEKFLNIKCRKAGLTPALAVLVATVRAVKMNGGAAKAALGEANPQALRTGLDNLGRHIANLKKFGLPVLTAINRFDGDRPEEIQAVQDYAAAQGAEAFLCTHWAEGSAGVEPLARRAIEVIEAGGAAFKPLYPDSAPLFEKIDTVARQIYGAAGVDASPKLLAQLKEWEASGYGDLPVCMAKTQYSFTADPSERGAPSGFRLPLSELRLCAGAGFVVALCGDVMTMPGLPRRPAAEQIGLDAEGRIEGLF